ncbi:MAG: FG-GAP repeat domain-containing protein, partial [Planctomycetota bacterium]
MHGLRFLLGAAAILASLILALAPLSGGETYRHSRKIRLAPGEWYALEYDPVRREFRELEPDRRYGRLPEEALDQILRAPTWLREGLADRLVDLVHDDIDVGESAAPALFDVNGDGVHDLVVGTGSGKIHCFPGPGFRRAPELFRGDRFSGKVRPVVRRSKEKAGAELIALDGDLRIWSFDGKDRFRDTGKVSAERPGVTLKVSGKELFLLGREDGTLEVRGGGPLERGLVENLGRVKVEGDAHPALHDVNGDGVEDLLVGSRDGKILVVPNRGAPGKPWFSLYSPEIKRKFDIDVGYLSTPRLADWDGDGKLDLLSGSKEGKIHLFLGPDFRQGRILLEDRAFHGAVVPAPGDFDGDGTIDLAVGSADGGVRLFKGPGLEEDAARSGKIRLHSYASPWAVDFDRDGRTDLIVGSGKNPFGDIESGEFPSPAMVDIDGDGDLDLVVGNGKGEFALHLAPAFEVSPGGLGVSRTGAFASAGFGDLDGDGRPELVVGSIDGGFVYFDGEDGVWVEKESWTFEPSMGVKDLKECFLRCHRDAKPLRGRIDDAALGAVVELLTGSEDRYFDEVAFALSALPTEVLRAMTRMGEVDLLLENARCIYETAQRVKYAEVLEKGDHTTLKYALEDGGEAQLPKEVYYWWVVHPRLYYEVPARVNASFWEKTAKERSMTEEAWTRRRLTLDEMGKKGGGT